MTAPVSFGIHAQHALEEPGKDKSSQVAKKQFYDYMSWPLWARHEIFANHMTPRDRDALARTAFAETGTAYGMWVDDPVGFVTYVLVESTWSKQREVLAAIPFNDRVAVPSAFGTGKTHIAARAALWRSCVHAPGTSLTVTTATRFRQVQRQLWPHIGACAAKAKLPLDVDQTQMHGYDINGRRVPIAYGFSAPPHDEAAVQGIHAPNLFIVVDEAGGIGRTIGEAMRGLLTGEDTRMLAIGNPPTDDEGSWFEQLCGDEDVKTIPISAYDAPAQSRERTRDCEACPPQVPAHGLARHLVNQKWIDDTVHDHGEDSPFVKAKVYAKFPRGGSARAIPADWVDMCVESPEPEGQPGYVRLVDLNLPGEDRPWYVREQAWVRLGVDVAAGGGDEFVISRIVGDLVTIEHVSSGAANSSSVDVSGVVLEHIRRANLLRAALGTTNPVRVKVDGIGVGWGVASTLQAWASEQIHDAEIVSVIVSEDTYREDDPKATFRPWRKRDEMWLYGRDLVQPRAETGRGRVRLRVGKRAIAQLSGPKYGTNSGGKTVIESKDKMKARGLPSPDQAEAILLAPYEPILKHDEGVFRIIA